MSHARNGRRRKVTRKPRLPFCWVCSRQLHGKSHRVAIVHGNEVVVHASCASDEGLEVKPDAHLVTEPT